MATSSSPLTYASFDQFHVDFTSGELLRSGVRVAIQGQPFHVLRLLLEADGKVVTREELRQALWPQETFVDFEHGVNTAVKKLRQALEDSAEHPKFIETLPRYGYRFTVPVEWLPGNNDKISPPSVVQLTGHAYPHPNWFRIGAGILLGAILAAAFLFVYVRWRLSADQSFLTSVPLTALPGLEVAPTFSPDGTSIAFAWSGDSVSGSKGFDLYVKTVGTESASRLTHHPSQWITPSWSPDGTQIAFHRISGADTGLYVVPALGGSERKLRSTNINDRASAQISWSADGKWVAYVDSMPMTVNLLSIETFENQRLPHTANCIYEGNPAFSHHGSRLAYMCSSDLQAVTIYTCAISGGTPKLVATLSFGEHAGIAWTSDDSRLILALNKSTGNELFELTLANGTFRKLSAGQDAAWPAISQNGDRLAFTNSSQNINIWRKDLLHPESGGLKLLSSTRKQMNPNYSPDGKHIAFESTRSGIQEIWTSDADGTNLVQISKLNNVWTGTPRWSPDGTKIAFDSWLTGHPEVYVVDVSELVSRKIATNVSEMFLPRWSHDGKWLYFLSGAMDVPRIYRCPVKGGKATLLSSGPAFGIHESFDGETLYFADGWVNARLRKLSVNEIGLALPVEGMPLLKDANLWTLVPGGIYFVPADAPHSIDYLDLSTRKVRRIADVDRDFRSVNGGFSVSPDGRWILYSQVDENNSDIMLVDHFR